jgi:hypothetical protein
LSSPSGAGWRAVAARAVALEREAARADAEARRAQAEATQQRMAADRLREADATREMARRDADLLREPQAPPADDVPQGDPPRSAGGAGSAVDAGTQRGEDMDRWIDNMHFGSDHGSDHGADLEYDHGGAPPRVI